MHFRRRKEPLLFVIVKNVSFCQKDVFLKEEVED